MRDNLTPGETPDDSRNPGLGPSTGEVLGQAHKAAHLKVTGRFLRRSDPQPLIAFGWTFETGDGRTFLA
jgi:hypothetical protein